jgi:hypothetical protein
MRPRLWCSCSAAVTAPPPNNELVPRVEKAPRLRVRRRRGRSRACRNFGARVRYCCVEVPPPRQDLVARFFRRRVQVPEQHHERFFLSGVGALLLGGGDSPLLSSREGVVDLLAYESQDQLGALLPRQEAAVVPMRVGDDQVGPRCAPTRRGFILLLLRREVEVAEMGKGDHARLAGVPAFRAGLGRRRREPAVRDRNEFESGSVTRKLLVDQSRGLPITGQTRGGWDALSIEDRHGFARVFAVVSSDANMTPPFFLILASKELGEVPELVVEDFLESDYVQLVEQDLVDELVPAAVPALFAPRAVEAEQVGGGFEERVARVDVVADVEAADAESRSP